MLQLGMRGTLLPYTLTEKSLTCEVNILLFRLNITDVIEQFVQNTMLGGDTRVQKDFLSIFG